MCNKEYACTEETGIAFSYFGGQRGELALVTQSSQYLSSGSISVEHVYVKKKDHFQHRVSCSDLKQYTP